MNKYTKINKKSIHKPVRKARIEPIRKIHIEPKKLMKNIRPMRKLLDISPQGPQKNPNRKLYKKL